LFKLDAESPWVLRNTGLCHIQNLRGLPAWVIDKQGLKATEDALYAKEQIGYIIQELKDATGKDVQLNSPQLWERYSMYKNSQATGKKEVILETKNQSDNPNETKKVSMGAEIREQLKSALITATGDQFNDAAEAYIIAIEATADQLGDPALADTAGQALLAKLGGSTDSQNKDDAGKLQDLVNASVKKAVDEAVGKALENLNTAGKDEKATGKLNFDVERYINDRVKVAINGAEKPRIGSQIQGANPDRPDPMAASAEGLIVRR
jgi:hypothetical protein